jgi:hypothetical protein
MNCGLADINPINNPAASGRGMNSQFFDPTYAASGRGINPGQD